MTSANIKILIRFLLLIPLQVLIANHMRLFGYINPQICLLFVLWYPLKKDVSGFLANSFLFGLIIDMFSNSGGVNAAACLLIAYTRLPMRESIGKRLSNRDGVWCIHKILNVEREGKENLVIDRPEQGEHEQINKKGGVTHS